jgi:Tfp pilus assembly protein PilX
MSALRARLSGPLTMPRAGQRGATLIIGLIMMVLITLVVVSAFTLSSSNLKSVGNMQVRDEAVAAANQAIEQLISASFTDSPGTVTYNIDINKDGANDYEVRVAPPVCGMATAASEGYPSDVELPTGMTLARDWNTEWDISATVTDSASGASVRVRQGVRVRLSQTQKDGACS